MFKFSTPACVLPGLDNNYLEYVYGIPGSGCISLNNTSKLPIMSGVRSISEFIYDKPIMYHVLGAMGEAS